ncbi:GTPase activating protein [Ephemerocybe angulata]|uniref:GTPase activating protein n=1 Tax=Ephemerocybe angulata TaxID=980116 RepID=A0A8H6IIF2_9AGAR|nr:GTPase activating protein [Tulosesus angulatus]
MPDSWDHYSPSTQNESLREFLVSAELYVSSTAGSALRKPAVIKKKAEKGFTGSSTIDESKLREKSSLGLSKRLAGAGQWRTATCKLLEEGDRCFLNIYVDEAILYQTVYLHLLNQTDIRHADSSLFFRKDCVGLYCIAGQRWTSSHVAEPIYLQFANSDVCSTWLALLRSYAIPEIYGRWFFPLDGGSYRMWRQIDLNVDHGRNVGISRTDTDNAELPQDGEADADVSCEIHLNDIICGRTTTKKRGATATVEWHESFTFPELPPFDTLDLVVWREKKVSSPKVLGYIRIPLSNFRRGELIEGWFPIMQTHTGPAREIQVGELRLKIRVDEEIVLPYSAYRGLLRTIQSRNFLDWLTELETKLKLKSISTAVMSLAVANDTLIKQIQDYATREVLESSGSHQTLFRGNTVLTKIMESAMSWYGKAFLDASIGHVLRRLCTEKIAIEVDPMRSRKGTKELERNVDLLIYWCQEFWNQIYSARCKASYVAYSKPFAPLWNRRQRETTFLPSTETFPKQSVSAFCFLRFIVPAILHPHLFGLYPGSPPETVQRSLTLIAKVIQSLANLNASSQKESFMSGVKDFITSSLPAMTDYIAAVSAPLNDPYPSNPVMAAARHNRLHIIHSLRERSVNLTVLDREAIPVLPHLLDIPRQLAVITSAVIRSSRDPSLQQHIVALKGTPVEDLCNKCFEVEEQALIRVTQLASKLSLDRRRPSLPVIDPQGPGPSASLASLDRIPETPKPRMKRKTVRPSTAPSSGSPSRRFEIDDSKMPSSPRVFTRSKGSDEPRSPPPPSADPTLKVPRRPLHIKAPSTDSVPTFKSATSPTKERPMNSFNDLPDDTGKRKKGGILRGILRL